MTPYDKRTLSVKEIANITQRLVEDSQVLADQIRIERSNKQRFRRMIGLQCQGVSTVLALSPKECLNIVQTEGHFATESAMGDTAAYITLHSHLNILLEELSLGIQDLQVHANYIQERTAALLIAKPEIDRTSTIN